MKIRIAFLSCLLVASFTSTFGLASELLTAGSIEVGAGWSLLEESNEESGPDETDDQSYPLIGGSGSIAVPLGESFSTQIDVSGEKNYASADGDDNQDSMIFGGAHLSLRDPGRGLIGIFGGGGRGWTERYRGDTNATWIGVEGQAYLGDATLYLQAARVSGDVEDTEENFRPAYVLRGVGRYFLDDDSRIELQTSYANANDAVDGGDDMWAIDWALRYDRRIRGGWHGFGAYRGAYFDTTTEGEQLTEHIAMVGIRYLFGAESLKANDRLGATLDQPSLPMRATNWVEPLD